MRAVTPLAAALVTVACTAVAPVGSVAIQTMPELTVCEAARIHGVLAADPHYGLGFKADGGVSPVVWPHGYSARRESDGIVVLVDAAGNVAAREGDRIEAAGAYNELGVPLAECDLQRISAPSD
jgi:hypothetical protein